MEFNVTKFPSISLRTNTVKLDPWIFAEFYARSSIAAWVGRTTLVEADGLVGVKVGSTLKLKILLTLLFRN